MRPAPLALLLLAALPAAAQFTPARFYLGLSGGDTSMRVVDQDTGAPARTHEPSAGLLMGAWLTPVDALEMEVRFLGQVDVGTITDWSGRRVRATREVSDLSFGYLRRFPLNRQVSLFARGDLIMWTAGGRRYGRDYRYDGYDDPDRRTGTAFGLQGGVQVRLTRRVQFRAGVEATSTILDSTTTQWQAGITYTF